MNRRTFLSAALAAPIVAAGCNDNKSRVTLYCAQDREFAESILTEFSQRTSIEVAAKYDSEADKSVGLVEELIREKGRPRCDVFWNNEILGTIRLSRHGVLANYSSPSAAPFPDWTKAPTFQMFAARARVLLVNRKLTPKDEPPQTLFDLNKPRWRGRVGMARPFFGTTATHAACLFAALGNDIAEQFFRNLKENNVQVVSGNKQSAQAVSRGESAVGLTDTDDAIIEVEAGYPVEIVFPKQDNNSPGTLYLPNTVALINDSPNATAGRKLIDFLLSGEVEAKLAANASRQIPLSSEVKAELPASILRPEQINAMTVDFEKAADAWAHAQKFLSGLFA